MKLHLNSSPSSPDFRPPAAFFEGAEEITLEAGSVLYHPAGIWHHVECLSDDSVSINVSLSIASWADIISDAMRQLFWESPVLRAPVVGLSDVKTHPKVQALLLEAQRRASKVSWSAL